MNKLLSKTTLFILILLIIPENIFSFNREYFSSNNNIINLKKFDITENDFIPTKDTIIDSSLIKNVIIPPDSVLPIEKVSFLISNSQIIDKFLLERANFFSPLHLLSSRTNSFLFDPGLPSNFYELSLMQNNNRSISFILSDIELNEPLTNLFDLRDVRFDEINTIFVILPTRSFLISRFNNPSSVMFKEWRRYSPIPYTKIKYIEAPYDNLFFDGMFNVNLTPRLNFEFGVTKHNAYGRFLNSEKDLWAGKIKSTYFFSNQINLNFTYLYSKSINRFSEGVNLKNPLLAPGEPIENIIYDNQRALMLNDDAYHKWTTHSINLEGLLKPFDISQTQLNLYFNQSLREFRDNEHKADSLKIFHNHWSKVFGLSLKENLNYLFNNLEIKLNYERIIIESPFYFQNKLIDNHLSGYLFYQLNLLDFIQPAFYSKFSNYDHNNINYLSYGTDLTINLPYNFKFIFGFADFIQSLSYDERYFNTFNLTDNKTNNQLYFGNISYLSKNLKLSLEGFLRNTKYASEPTGYYSIEQNDYILNYFPSSESTFGGKFDIKYSFWKLNSSLSFIYNDRIQKFNGTTYHKIIQPRYQSRLEVYFNDILFKSSLDLIAGVRINGFSSFSARNFSPSKLVLVDIRTYNDSLFNYASIKIPANFTIDLFASGRVKESAIVYLSLENVLDRKYYLIPYYPANDIQFRFGLMWEFYD